MSQQQSYPPYQSQQQLPPQKCSNLWFWVSIGLIVVIILLLAFCVDLNDNEDEEMKRQVIDQDESVEIYGDKSEFSVEL